jgi:hypothetical protein
MCIHRLGIASRFSSLTFSRLHREVTRPGPGCHAGPPGRDQGSPSHTFWIVFSFSNYGTPQLSTQMRNKAFQFMTSSPSLRQLCSPNVGSELESDASRRRFETRLNDIEAEMNLTKLAVKRLNDEVTRSIRVVRSLYALAQSLDESRFRELRLENIAINSQVVGQIRTQTAEFSIPFLNIWYNISSSARDLHRNSLSTKDVN